MNRQPQYTIKDIAAEMGVSVSTVSRALSNHPHISEETKVRVRELVEKHDYRHNALASSLRNSRSNTIGLILAEAEFKQGKLDEAAESINELRRRANAPLVSAADIDLNFILDERARELIGEENRRFTLMRTGTLVERATRLNTNIPGLPENRQITGISETHLLMPIPQNEIDLNKDAELEQNPGY